MKGGSSPVRAKQNHHAIRDYVALSGLGCIGGRFSQGVALGYLVAAPLGLPVKSEVHSSIIQQVVMGKVANELLGHLFGCFAG